MIDAVFDAATYHGCTVVRENMSRLHIDGLAPHFRVTWALDGQPSGLRLRVTATFLDRPEPNHATLVSGVTPTVAMMETWDSLVQQIDCEAHEKRVVDALEIFRGRK